MMKSKELSNCSLRGDEITATGKPTQNYQSASGDTVLQMQPMSNAFPHEPQSLIQYIKKELLRIPRKTKTKLQDFYEP